jgi:hypothetical protein
MLPVVDITDITIMAKSRFKHLEPWHCPNSKRILGMGKKGQVIKGPA